MKKIISLLLVLTLMLGLAACGGGSNETTPGGNQPAETQNQGGSEEQNQTQPQTQPQEPVVSGAITEELLRGWPETPASEFTYSNSLKYDGIVVTGYTGSGDIVVIPGQIDGKTVVEVAGYCFANDSIVRGVVIPETVIESSEVFINNDRLEMVIAEGLQDIGYATFHNCDALREVILGSDVKHIGESAFGSCKSLEELHLGAAVEGMDETEQFTAFYGCKKLTIYGEAGSFIETVANQQGIPFVAE